MKRKLVKAVLVIISMVVCAFGLVACHTSDDDSSTVPTIPGTAETPDTSETPEKPDTPSTPGKPGTTEPPETPVTPEPPIVSVTGVTLDKAELILEVGSEETLAAMISPENAADKAVIWGSSDDNIAMVENGVIAAKSAGTATVTVKSQDGNHTATCSITVYKVDGWYVLSEKTVQGANLADEYLVNAVRLENGKASFYETDISGQTVKECNYTKNKSADAITVRVNDNGANTVFDYSVANKTLGFSGAVNGKQTAIKYVYSPDFTLPMATGGVEFTGELFGDDIKQNYYNYAPSVMMESNDTMHVWYCSNWVSGNVTDYIAYRKGTLNAAGKWVFTEKLMVLSPSTVSGAWDSRHVCDPSVIKGSFKMGGETYSYLMAYLGCKTDDSSKNEVGIAVSKKPEGPFIKVERLNPIADFYNSQDYIDSNAATTWKWGYGQPSLVSVDNAGKVLLFYTKGAVVTGTNVEEWDLSNLDTASACTRKAALKESGIMNALNGGNCIHNGDFAYDPILNRLYCYVDDFPNPNDGGVDVISGTGALFYLNLGDKSKGFDLLFANAAYTWTLAGRLTPENTGFARNHNACIVTNEYGALSNPFCVPVVYTVSKLATDYPVWSGGGQWPFLHTYRLHGKIFNIA